MSGELGQNSSADFFLDGHQVFVRDVDFSFLSASLDDDCLVKRVSRLFTLLDGF